MYRYVIANPDRYIDPVAFKSSAPLVTVATRAQQSCDTLNRKAGSNGKWFVRSIEAVNV